MAGEIPHKVEWDDRTAQWVPYKGVPGRAVADWNSDTGAWVITRPDAPQATGLGKANPLNWITPLLPASVERGLLGTMQGQNISGTAQVDPALAAENIAELERRKRAVAAPEETQATIQQLMSPETGALDAVKLGLENPGAVLSLIGEGLGAMIPDVAAGYAGAKLGALAGTAAAPGPGTAIGSAVGAAAGFGLSGGVNEYGRFILGRLEREGVDLSDPEATLAALKDKELMDRVRENAATSGLAVGAINAAMMGLSGRVASLVGAVPKAATKYTPAYTPSVASRVAAGAGETAVEVGLGTAGGAASSYLDTGEIIPADIILGAATGIPFAGREVYRAARGFEATPGVPTRAEFNTRAEAESFLKESGFWRKADELLPDQDIVLKAEEVKDAQGAGAYRAEEAPPLSEQELERRTLAKSMEEPAPEPAPRTELEVVNVVKDPETQIGLKAARAIDPEVVLGQTVIAETPRRPSDIPRTVAEGEVLTVGRPDPELARLDAEQAAVRQQLAQVIEQRAQVPESVRPEIDVQIEQLRARDNDIAAAREIFMAERPGAAGEVGRVRAPMEPREVFANTPEGVEQRRYETLVQDVPPGKPVGPERFTPEVLQELDDRGFIRKIPGGEDYVRVQEPFKIDAPISREEYRVITDRLDPAAGKFEPGDPVTLPMIQGMLRTERGKAVPVADARATLDFLEKNQVLLRGRDEQGRPALLNNFRPGRGATAAPEIAATKRPELERPKPRMLPRDPVVKRAVEMGEPQLKQNAEVAARIKKDLPEKAKVLEEKNANAETVAKDADTLGFGKEVLKPVRALLSPIVGEAPLKSDNLTSISFLNRIAGTLARVITIYPKLKTWGNATLRQSDEANRVRRKGIDIVSPWEKATDKQKALITDAMEIADSAGDKLQLISTPEGGIVLKWRADDLDYAPRRGRADGELVIPKTDVPLWNSVRKFFEDMYDEVYASRMRRYGMEPTDTLDTIRAKADKAKGAEKNRLEGLATLLELTNGYRVNYLPHVRETGPKAVWLLGNDKNGESFIQAFDDSFTRGRSQAKANKAREREAAKGSTNLRTVYAIDSDLVQQLGDQGDVDAVIQMVQLLSNTKDTMVLGADKKPLTDAQGRPMTQHDLMLETLGELRRKVGAEKEMRGLLTKRKGVKGYIHEGNERDYVDNAIVNYLSSAADFVANNNTWTERMSGLQDVAKDRDLYAFALNHEARMKEPDFLAAKFKAGGFMVTLAGNLSTALLQPLQIPTTALTYMAGLGGVGSASKHLLASTSRIMAYARTNLSFDPDRMFSFDKKPPGMSQEKYDFFRAARDNYNAYSPVLMRELGGGTGFSQQPMNEIERAVGRGLAKTAKVMSSTFAAAEAASRLIVLDAAYDMLKANPKAFEKLKRWSVENGHLKEPPKDLTEAAVFLTKHTMFNPTRENQSMIFQGWGGVLLQFQQIPIMMMEFLANASVAGGKGFLGTREAKLMTGIFLGSTILMAGAYGLPGVEQALDATDKVSNIYARLTGTNPINARREVREALVELINIPDLDENKKLLNIVLKGALRETSGLSVEKRLALNLPLSDTSLGSVLDLAGPLVSVVTRGIEDAMGYHDQGRDGLALASLIPSLPFRNMVQAAYARPGEHVAGLLGIPKEGIGLPSAITGLSPIKTTGKPGEGEGPLSFGEAFAKSIGFTPSRVADIREGMREMKSIELQRRRRAFSDKVANLYADKIIAEQSGQAGLVKTLEREIRRTIDERMAQDREADPSKAIITESFSSTLQDKIKTRLTGPFSADKIQKLPKDQRAVVVERLRNLYGIEVGS